jgi:hypothetical protein
MRMFDDGVTERRYMSAVGRTNSHSLVRKAGNVRQ